MANAIELAKSYVPKLDEVYKLAALTSVLDSDGAELKEGANAGEFIIPKMSMDGLGAYDRNNGYAQGSVTMENETVKANFDRGRKFVVDVADDLETAGLAFGKLSAEFIRTMVVPEVDAFRFAAYCGADGATTVAATMIVAAMAGIRVFATGGIGGVHRGAEVTMDISADLEELARTPVAVVCAGAKSILDLGLTLEYLETKGVPVLGYRTETLPAFYTDESDFKVDYRMDSPEEIAAAVTAQRDMGYPGGMLITNPIPHQYAMPKDVIDAAINQALAEAKEQGVKGKATTPFLLARVCELTGGESLKSNIKLVLNNVALGAQIAAAMH